MKSIWSPFQRESCANGASAAAGAAVVAPVVRNRILARMLRAGDSSAISRSDRYNLSLNLISKVLPIDTPGGPSDPIAQPKIKTFFELSLVPADYSTIYINPPK